MIQCSLTRTKTGDDGTFGLLQTPNHSLFTGELPWRDNKTDLSCIPDGSYVCRWLYSPHHNRNIYHVLNVPNRGDVEIHSGNYCGDVERGYRSDVLGCIILGQGRDAVNVDDKIHPAFVQEIISESRKAIQEFENEMATQDFKLTVKCGEGIGPFEVLL
jgi:hypothetical protein